MEPRVCAGPRPLRSLLCSYLTRGGYRALNAGNGREALRLANTQKPDLVILDVMMPEMDDCEFLRRHRQESTARR